MSVTGLLRPPRITLLHKKHAPDIVSDVSEHIYSLMGRAIHKVLEDGGDEEHLTEERLFTTIRGWVISGQIDLQKISPTHVRITDYKNTSAYAVMHEKPEWTEQANTYAHLIRECKGWNVDALSICAIVRDWSRHKVSQDADYPAAPVVMIPLPLWPADAARKFVEERVRVHQHAIASWDMGEEPPLCSDEERWMRKPSWAVKKTGGKRPWRVLDNPKEAEELVEKMGTDYVIEHRKGEPVRCTNNYCQVAPWCSQYAKWLEEKVDGGDDKPKEDQS